jgi:hypothetical protein
MASTGGVIAAVIAAEQEKIINYLKNGNAFDKATAIEITNPEVARLLPRYRRGLFFVKNEGDKYWIDKEKYSEYKKRQSRIMLLVLAVLVIGFLVFLAIFLLT